MLPCVKKVHLFHIQKDVGVYIALLKTPYHLLCTGSPSMEIRKATICLSNFLVLALNFQTRGTGTCHITV